MHTRPLQVEDISQVVVLGKQLLDHHGSFDKNYYDLEENYAVDFSVWAREHLSFDYKFIYVAQDNDKIIGFISGYIKYLFPWFKIKCVGHIAYLVIEKNYQGRGIGKLLENEATNWFRSKNIKYVELYVDELNETGKIAWKSYGYQSFKKFLRKSI